MQLHLINIIICYILCVATVQYSRAQDVINDELFFDQNSERYDDNDNIINGDNIEGRVQVNGVTVKHAAMSSGGDKSILNFNAALFGSFILSIVLYKI